MLKSSSQQRAFKVSIASFEQYDQNQVSLCRKLASAKKPAKLTSPERILTEVLFV